MMNQTMSFAAARCLSIRGKPQFAGREYGFGRDDPLKLDECFWFATFCGKVVPVVLGFCHPDYGLASLINHLSRFVLCEAPDAEHALRRSVRPFDANRVLPWSHRTLPVPSIMPIRGLRRPESEAKK